MTLKHNESVQIGEKLASVCFDSIGKPHERQIVRFVGHAYRPCPVHAGHVLPAHAHNWPSIGKSCQQLINAAPSLLRYNYAAAARGVCALDSSSYYYATYIRSDPVPYYYTFSLVGM